MAGWRTGFVRRSLSWAGFAVGLVVALVLVPDVSEALKGSPPRARLLASLAFVLVVTTVLQALGASLGAFLRGRLPARPGVQRADRIAGCALGVIGALVVVWLLIPALASSPGWPARATRSSAVIRVIDRLAPAPPEESETLGRLVGDQTFPRCSTPSPPARRGNSTRRGDPGAAQRRPSPGRRSRRWAPPVTRSRRNRFVAGTDSW
jgi:tetrahydromethanopterin S-methyltransferase subunit F